MLHHRPLGGGQMLSSAPDAERSQRDETVMHSRVVADRADQLAHDTDVPVNPDGAGVPGRLTGEKPEKGGLADAVGPDESGVFPVADPEGDISEEGRAAGPAPGEVAYLDHAHGWFTLRVSLCT